MEIKCHCKVSYAKLLLPRGNLSTLEFKKLSKKRTYLFKLYNFYQNTTSCNRKPTKYTEMLQSKNNLRQNK